jgi:hypothetical protein
MKKSRLCRLLCGKALPFRPSRLEKKNNPKTFRFSRLPESRKAFRTAGGRAAAGHLPSHGPDFHTFASVDALVAFG